jgi:hypothetical protein
MKKILLSLLVLASATVSKAQWQPDGSTITSNFTMTDLNNNTIDAFALFNQGKHLVIDFSATWCGPCWAYHSSHVLDAYYDKNGPNGTYIKDAQVVFYEVDGSTTLADLQGTGGNTQGDWITGTSNPICNPSNSSAVVGKFLAPGTTSYGVPAVFVVCNDKKLYKISTGITTEPALRSYIAGKCGLAPLSQTEVMDLGFTYDLYPNPAEDIAHLRLQMDEAGTVSYSLKNALGQTVINGAQQQIPAGLSTFDIPTGNLPAGLYFVQLQVGKRQVNARLMVN